eukprot:maker-scaffold_3-snap-gene-3.3-mRNA-1 protein AED:0.00 eAED:0.00 QI:7/1/1/1/0/0.5/2/160/410
MMTEMRLFYISTHIATSHNQMKKKRDTNYSCFEYSWKTFFRTILSTICVLYISAYRISNPHIRHEKFFIYQPSGGFNNQRIEMQNALRFCQILNRTLIVPMAARHSNLGAYIYLGYDSTIPMDLLIDVDYLNNTLPNGFGDVVPLNMNLVKYLELLHEVLEDGDIAVMPIRKIARPKSLFDCNTEKFIAKFKGQSEKKVIAVLGHFHCHYFRDDENRIEMEKISQAIRYSKTFRLFSLKLYQESFNYEFMNGVHIRTGDYFEKLGGDDYLKHFLHTIAKRGPGSFKKNEPLYIATNPSDDNSLMNIFVRHFESVYFYKDLNQSLVKMFHSGFTQLGIIDHRAKLDFFGLVEQLLLSLMTKFKGTRQSTFSWFIDYTRQDSHLMKLFPELFDVHGLRMNILNISVSVETYS